MPQAAYFFGASTAIAIASVMTISTCSPTLISFINAGSFTFIDMFVRQWPAAYDVPSINIYVYSTVAPYYPRFVQGALDGSRGGAEYEVLTKYPGAELIKLNARNLQGLWVLVTIVIGNIAFFGARSKKILAEGQKT